MKGFKSFGKGSGKSGHSYPSHFGFSGSAGQVQVRGHSRTAPKKMHMADGGHVHDDTHVIPPDYAKGGSVCAITEGAGPMMAKGGHWIQKAIKHPGALHRALGVPQGQKIPVAKINKAAHSSNPTLARRANLAKTLGTMHKAKGGHVSVGDQGHSAVHRDEPVVESDKEYGGKTPLRTGFKAGGMAKMKQVAKSAVNKHVATPPPRGHGIKSVGSFSGGPRFGK